MKKLSHLTFIEQREKNIEKVASRVSALTQDIVEQMLNLGKQTPRGGASSVISRPPQYGLAQNLSRSGDLGRVVSQIDDFTGQANQAKNSVMSTYFGGEKSPLSLLTKAKDTAYSPLSKGFAHEGSTLKQLAERELEESIFRSLSRQAHIPDVENYARHLIRTKGQRNGELDHLLKQVRDDFSVGKEPVIMVRGKGAPIALQVDRPIASFNGSPVINTKKTLNIDGIETFNQKHMALEKDLQRKWQFNGGQWTPETLVAGEKLERSKNFKNAFEDKLKLMSSSESKDVNRAQFTLDDLDSVHKVEVFLKNPHLETKHKLLDDATHDNISNWIVNQVRNSPKDIKHSLSDALDLVAQDPKSVNYLQGFQFQRYSTDEMRKVMEAVKGTKSNLNAERLRVISDAMGAVGIAGLGGLGMYASGKAMNPEPYDPTKLLHHRNQEL